MGIVFRKKNPKLEELEKVKEKLESNLNYYLDSLVRIQEDLTRRLEHYRNDAGDAKIKLDAINKEIERVKKEG